MCGIAGFFHQNGAPASPTLIKRMNGFIAHRGPDGEGHYVDGPLALGHRRLAILDRSTAAHQPMATADGRYVITYNGEIYNFQNIRAQLAASGSLFHSQGDTEVLLLAFERWGLDALQHLNGMFAFAIWDSWERRLTLVRDRFGIKPLYYAWAGDTFIFGSEIKAILAYPGVARAINLEGLVEYMSFQNFFTDRTLFKGIQMLPAGHHLTLDLGSGPGKPVRYWDFSFEEPEAPLTEGEYLEQLDFLFRQAVSRQMISDVDVGSYLSGGMDSGSITALAAQQIPYLRTFTCGFDLHSASGIELNFDERSTAEYMSYLFRTEHYEVVLKAGDMERVLPRLTWHLEEPRVGQSYPNYFIAGLASKFVKVTLSGTGGDEMFGGYPWRYYRAMINSDFSDYAKKYYDFWQRLIPAEKAAQIFSPIWSDIKHIDPRSIFSEVFANTNINLQRPEDYINYSLYFEAKTFLHGLLTVEDKLSMAHGLEARVPFLDNDLVDFAMKLPVRHKLGKLQDIVRLNENDSGAKPIRYFQRTNDGKLLLRKLMMSYLPPEVAEREKQGFSAPDASWFKGDSINYVREKLYRNNASIYQFLDRKAIQGIVNEHLDGQNNHRLLIWSLLNLENWWEQFIETQAFNVSLAE